MLFVLENLLFLGKNARHLTTRNGFQCQQYATVKTQQFSIVDNSTRFNIPNLMPNFDSCDIPSKVAL